MQRARRYRRGKDHAHRLHRAGEPQLRQSLSGISRRRHRVEGQELEGRDDRAAAGRALQRRTTSTIRQGDVRGVRRNRQTARHEVPHGRLRSKRAFVRPAAVRSPSTSTCRTTSRSRTSTWRTSGCSPTDMFQSQLDESFVAHQYIIAAQAQSSVESAATACGAAGGGASDRVATHHARAHVRQPSRRPCFDYKTLGDELDKAKLSWRFYTSKYGSPSSGDGGYLVGLSGRQPHLLRTGLEERRHHAAEALSHRRAARTSSRTSRGSRRSATTPITSTAAGGYGPSWVAALVNAVGKSKFWDSTAIFVQWDDWGGLYDHVPPPFKDYDGLGFRVPLLVISPYAKNGYVSHVQYETASVLRFAEDLFGLDQLAAADGRAKSPAADCFDFSQKPRKFVPIKAPQGPRVLPAPGQRLPRSRLRITRCVALAALVAARRIAGCCRSGTAAAATCARWRCANWRNRAPARSTTSSTSCRRTAASTTCFRDIPVPTPFPTGKISSGKTVKLQPLALAYEYDIDHSAEAMFAACHGAGQAAGNALPDGRIRQGKGLLLAAEHTVSAVRLRAACGFEAVLRHGARVGRGRPNVPVAARRELRRRTNTSSRRRPMSSVDLPTALWGCGGGPSDRRHDDHRASAGSARRSRPASTTRRSATSSTAPACRGAFTPASTAASRAARAVTGRAIRPSNISATVPTGKKTSSRRRIAFLPTSRAGSWQTSRGSRPSATTPIT